MGARVMILAGGTGGHVYPALAVADELRGLGHAVTWMGTRSGLEARVVQEAGIPMEWLAVAGVRGKNWGSRLKAPFMLLRACWQALCILRRVRPDVVLGMGGFVSGPGGLMARLLGIPLVLHEQNRVPGTTNRWLARWANVVLEAFPGSFPASMGARCTGNPLRRDIAALWEKASSHGEARESVGLGAASDPDEPVHVLVLGGSQGAKALNETVPRALAQVRFPVSILHQTGDAMRAATEELYRRAGLDARVEAFVRDMAEAYRWADLAVCRSGAMTVSELAAAGLPAILIPFPHAIDDHQTANARYLAEAGAAALMPQQDMDAESLAALLAEWLAQPESMHVRARYTQALARPEAARSVAEICLAEAKQ